MKFVAQVILFGLFIPILASAEPFKVGLSIPLTGPVASFGHALKNAIQLAQSDHQDKSGARLRFLFEDSGYSGKGGLSSFNKLRESDKVDLVYVWGTTPAIAVAPVAQRLRFPLVVLSGEESVAASRNFVVDFTSRISDYSAATLEWARKKGFKRTAVLKIETQYIDTLFDGMYHYRNPDESLELLASFSSEQGLDFSSVVSKLEAKIKSNQIDSMAILLGTGQISLLYQKLSQQRITLPTYGSDYFGDQDEMNKAGPASIGAFYATQHTDQVFLQRYKEAFGNTTCVSYAANMYDFASLAFKLFGDASSGQLSGSEIVARLGTVDPVDGAAGTHYFVSEKAPEYQKPGNRFIFPIVVKEVQADGSSREVYRWHPKG